MVLPVPPTPIVPKVGLVVASTARIKAGTYLLKSGGLPVLTVKGNGIVVDFTGVVLRGTPATAMPDARTGLGVRVEGRNVTIKGLHAHGYKIGLLASQVKGLKLVDCDLSYNWRQHLLSTPDKEDLADWMSFHHNEKGEWLNQGTAVYLDRCDGFEVKNLRATGGQSGLFLDRSNKGLVWNSDLSFNSALGIGMYRASENQIMHNRIDYDVRGFSYGVYNRGQDSAGILVFEQCNRNVFAYNSVTHGGDGFFLWAGQDTMDSGVGGCNDNLCFANDFSYAPTNAIEATFSRNAFVANRIHGSFHGVWGGYSYDTKIVANDFRGNQRGVAIEHGQANEIALNRFEGEDVAIAFWADAPDPSFKYALKRDVRSRDNRIVGNEFVRTPLALDLRGTTNTLMSENVFDHVQAASRVPKGETPFSPIPVTNTFSSLVGSEAVPGVREIVANPVSTLGYGILEAIVRPAHLQDDPLGDYRIPALKGGNISQLIHKVTDLQGWPNILIDEWGPYDFKRPLLTPEKKVLGGGAPLPGGTSAGSGTRKAGEIKETGYYRVLGPKGKWRLVSSEGVTLGAKSGVVPGLVKIDVPKGRVGTTKVELEYVGGATTDVRGIVTPAGKAVRFGFSKFFAPIDWDVKFFAWKESENPTDPHAVPKDFASVLASPPIKSLKTDKLDFAGYAFVSGLPTTHYATAADGTFTVPAGSYALELTTDDGARVWLDGKPLIEDAWHYQGPTAYARTVSLAGGPHRLRVEHFQIDGYATLKLSIKPKP
jgi:nitrous oxidase accessory protein NosD